MTLQALVKEVESRSAREVRDLEQKLDSERRALEEQTREEVGRIRAEADKQGQTESARERARLIAGAKLQAKKLLFEARERRTAQALDQVRDRLSAYAKTPEYATLLTNMVNLGTTVLGSDIVLRARPEDENLLPAKMRALVDDDRPLKGMGGLIVEKKDGSRALNLTFEELLRQHEDEVRGILAR